MNLAKKIDTLNRWIGKIFSNILILIMALAIYEVIMRYFFSSPTTWVWEINAQLMCLVGAMAGGYTLLCGSHVSVDIIAVRLSPRTRACIDIVTSLIFFFFSGCLIWFGAKEALRSYLVNLHSISQFASPLWPSKTLIPIGGVLIFLQGAAKLIRDIRIINLPRDKEGN